MECCCSRERDKKVTYFGRQTHTSAQSVTDSIASTFLSLSPAEIGGGGSAAEVGSGGGQGEARRGKTKKCEYIFAGMMRFPRNRFRRTKGRRKKGAAFYSHRTRASNQNSPPEKGGLHLNTKFFFFGEGFFLFLGNGTGNRSLFGKRRPGQLRILTFWGAAAFLETIPYSSSSSSLFPFLNGVCGGVGINGGGNGGGGCC